MEGKLVVISGEVPETEFPFRLPMVIGRSRQADIKLAHTLVSRKHCELFEANGELMVRDLGSLNGTFVGDARIAEATPLKPGSLLTIGAVTFQAVFGTEAGSGEVPDFVVAKPMSRSIEQTLEGIGPELEAPETKPAKAADDGFDLAWLDDPADASP